MKNVLMFAPVLTRSGYGEHARDLAYAILQSKKYNLKILATPWGNTPWNGLDESTEKGKQILKHTVFTLNDTKEWLTPTHVDIFIQLTIPNEFMRMGQFNIGITAGIETDLCKPEWIEGLNRMDLVVGVSQHTIKVFKESKFDKHDSDTNQLLEVVKTRENLHTEVLFEGVDTGVFKKTSILDPSIKKTLDSINEDFCFLFVGHWLDGPLGHDRKDVGSLVSTFCQAFVNKPPSTRPALILKTSSGNYSVSDKEHLLNKIEALQKGVQQQTGKVPPSVYLLHGDLSDQEMNSLYNHHKVKAMVSYTKGEGFGRPLLEFSFIGKPIIAPHWSGQVDFLHKDFTVQLPGTLEEVHSSVANNWFMKEAKWFKVDYAYATRILQVVFEKYKLYEKSALEQKKYVEKNFTYELMVDKFLKMLENTPEPVVKQVELKLPKLKRI